LTLTVPAYNHLGISGVGDAYGLGDLAIGYTQAFGGTKRLTQFAGLTTSFATGSAEFSAGRSQLSPMYGLSYALGRSVSLVASGEYTFDAGGTKLPFAPQTQSLSILPRAIIDFSGSGAYAAANLLYTSVTGQERYQAFEAGATVGVVRRHINLALNVSDPIAIFTREHVFYHAIGLQASWRR
jgi:hypothetical protein